MYYAKVDGVDDREDGFEVGNAQTIRDSDWTSPSMPRDTRDGHGVLPLSRHFPPNPSPPGPLLPLHAQTLFRPSGPRCIMPGCPIPCLEGWAWRGRSAMFSDCSKAVMRRNGDR